MLVNEGVREIFNGIWAVSSFFLLIVMTYFVLVTRQYGRRVWRFWQPKWYRDYGVIAAGSIIILVLGHFIRSFVLWIGYVFNSEFLAKWDWFFLIVATMVLLFGKLLCVYNFAPWAWRWRLLTTALTLSIVIPLLVFVFV